MKTAHDFHFLRGGYVAPRIYVFHERGMPEPLEAMDYTPYKEIDLPADFECKPLLHQLELAKQTIALWRSRLTSKPFGKVIGYELECAKDVSIFLNPRGEFGFDHEIGTPTASLFNERLDPNRLNHEYVIGYCADGFCSLVSSVEGEIADDTDLFYAQRFSSFSEAQAAADSRAASVFRLVNDGRDETLHEITVDLGFVESMPYAGCYHVNNQLLAGPSFVGSSEAESYERLRSLIGAGVTAIVSLIAPSELSSIRRIIDSFAAINDATVSQIHYNLFGVADRQTPSKNVVRIALDVLDGARIEGQRLFVHCGSGVGRTGVIIGSWLARHELGSGEAVLDRIAELRSACGLFDPSPETQDQRRFVREWRRGE
jgi:hypothetical protein